MMNTSEQSKRESEALFSDKDIEKGLDDFFEKEVDEHRVELVADSEEMKKSIEETAIKIEETAEEKGVELNESEQEENEAILREVQEVTEAHKEDLNAQELLEADDEKEVSEVSEEVIEQEGSEGDFSEIREQLEGAWVPEERIFALERAMEKNPDKVKHAARAMISKAHREHLVFLEAKMKQFEGVGGIRKLFGSGKEDFEELQDELKKTRELYEESRGEFVGENVKRMLFERMKVADARLDELKKEKGIGTKIYESYKKLGELNVYNLLKSKGKEPKGRIAKMALRAISVRTAISMGLLGVGGAFATPAAAAVPLLARRVMSGLGTGVGSYDLMRSVADRKKEPSFEKIKTMSKEELAKELEVAESRAMTGGKSLRGDKSYAAMRHEFQKKLEGSPLEKGLREEMKVTDEHLEELKQKREKNDTLMKVAAAGIGIAVGGYFAGKEFDKLSSSSTPDVVPDTMPESADVQIDGNGSILSEYTPEEHYGEEVWGLAEVKEGEGVSHVLMRQLEADPERFGFDPTKHHGDVTRWARRQAGKLVRDAGYWGKSFNKGIVFDSESPGHIVLVGDAKSGLTFQMLDVETKLTPRIQKIADVAQEMRIADTDKLMGALEDQYPDIDMLDTEEGRKALASLADRWATEADFGKHYRFDQIALGENMRYKLEHAFGGKMKPEDMENVRRQLKGIINKDIRPGESIALTDSHGNALKGADGEMLVLRQDYDTRRAAQWLYEHGVEGKLESPNAVIDGANIAMEEGASASVGNAIARKIVEEGGMPKALDEAMEVINSTSSEEIKSGIDVAVEGAEFHLEQAQKGISMLVKEAQDTLSDEASVNIASDIASEKYGSMTVGEMYLGMSWLERNIAIDNLKELAEGPAIAGGIKYFDNGVAYASGVESKRAAQYALEKLAERANNQEI